MNIDDIVVGGKTEKTLEEIDEEYKRAEEMEKVIYIYNKWS